LTVPWFYGPLPLHANVGACNVLRESPVKNPETFGLRTFAGILKHSFLPVWIVEWAANLQIEWAFEA